MKEFHWGHGITLFFILFVSTLIFVLFKSFTVDHNLVVQDYYAKDLAYQEQYDKEVNTLKDRHLKIDYVQSRQEVNLTFDHEEEVSGTVHYYRPSDEKADFIEKIKGKTHITDTKNLQKGRWKVKVDWQSNGKSYYLEKEIFI